MVSDIPKQTVLIKDLSTKSVTLYPARAHIVRAINDIVLRPGPNEIEIYGLTPTADEHSVQIDGKGAATVTDMTVDLVPNRAIFEEVYPEESDDSASESDEFEASDDENEVADVLSAELKALQAKLNKATETQASASRRLEVLDQYSKTAHVEHNEADDIPKMLKVYEAQRAEIYAAHVQAADEIEALNKQIRRKEREHWVAGKEDRKRKQRLEREKEKEREKHERQKAEKRKERQLVREQRIKFWPKKVYKVTLHLEASSSLDTPTSSRRGSVDSVTLSRGRPPTAGGSIGKTDDMKSNEKTASLSETVISLSLSYMTQEASWLPRYDLNLSSLTKSATIVYRAEFINATSETWKDAKVSLSTSQTSYQGLDDSVPFMRSWRVKLGKYGKPNESLLSTDEMAKPRNANATAPTINRRALFGVESLVAKPQKMSTKARKPQGTQKAPESNHLDRSITFARGAPHRASSSTEAMPGGPSEGLGFGSEQQLEVQRQQLEARQQQLSVLQRHMQPQKGQLQAQQQNLMVHRSSHNAAEYEEALREDAEAEAKEAIIVDELAAYEEPERQALEFEESSWEDNGLTATYDVPGVRTIAPSSTTIRHKIASLNASNIYMSYIAVPKLRPAAFLRAKVRNPSSFITLLKGSAGVTLDGSFLGNMNLPRVSPGQVFDLPLGVDPAIHVSYPKPTVHRTSHGIITKESFQVFNRSVWLMNTKSTPVELLILDQVPVSEDEKLRIDLLQPKGLNREGDVVRAGAPVKGGSSSATSMTQDGVWGKAIATLKKDGEVAWTVNLEKGQACLLKLDYEARLPSAERIVPAYGNW